LNYNGVIICVFSFLPSFVETYLQTKIRDKSASYDKTKLDKIQDLDSTVAAINLSRFLSIDSAAGWYPSPLPAHQTTGRGRSITLTPQGERYSGILTKQMIKIACPGVARNLKFREGVMPII
jgi:hypothetical protein